MIEFFVVCSKMMDHGHDCYALSCDSPNQVLTHAARAKGSGSLVRVSPVTRCDLLHRSFTPRAPSHSPTGHDFKFTPNEGLTDDIRLPF